MSPSLDTPTPPTGRLARPVSSVRLLHAKTLVAMVFAACLWPGPSAIHAAETQTGSSAVRSTAICTGVEEALARSSDYYRTLTPDDLAVDGFWLLQLLADALADPEFTRYARALESSSHRNHLFARLYRESLPALFTGPAAIAADHESVLFEQMERALYCDVLDHGAESIETILREQDSAAGYADTHVVFSLLLLQERGCAPASAVGPPLAPLLERLVAAQGDLSTPPDLFAERIVVLYWSGWGQAVKEEWIARLLRLQSADGTWRDPTPYVTVPHTTGLVSLALAYYCAGQAPQPFMLNLE